MARQSIETGNKNYTIAPCDSRLAGERLWAIVQARLIDELTMRHVVTPITVKTNKKYLTPQTTTGGLAGLVGTPARVFAQPDLTTSVHEFKVTFNATGYLAYDSTITIDPILDFPNDFTPVFLGEIEMHREPVVIRGRVMEKNATPSEPVAGATIRIAIENDPASQTYDPAEPSHENIWLKLPPATAVLQPDKLWIKAIKPNLYFPRKAGTTRIRQRELIHIPGQDKHLLEDAQIGSKSIRCSNRENLAIGQIIVVDAGDVATEGGNLSLSEYVRITGIDGTGEDDQPAVISLSQPLMYPHRRHAIVRRTNLQPTRANNELAVEAITGDSCLLLSSNNHLGEGQTIEIADGDQTNEYRRIFSIATTSDADGYFRLPPLHRVAQLNLQVSDGSSETNIKNFIPDYRSREQWIDLMI